MKKLFVSALAMLIVFCGCSANAEDVSKQNAAAEEPQSGLEKYLSETKEYVEPSCKALYDTVYVDDKGNLIRSLEDGTERVILTDVIDCISASDKSLFVLVRNNYISENEIIEYNVETGQNKSILRHSFKRPENMNTNGTLLLIQTETEVYRYYIPEKQLELIAVDETMDCIGSPLSTTEYFWYSYNPVWLKRCYEEGTDYIPNERQTIYVFYNAETNKAYRWDMLNAMDSPEVEGAAWYREQLEKDKTK